MLSGTVPAAGAADEAAAASDPSGLSVVGTASAIGKHGWLAAAEAEAEAETEAWTMTSDAAADDDSDDSDRSDGSDGSDGSDCSICCPDSMRSDRSAG